MRILAAVAVVSGPVWPALGVPGEALSVAKINGEVGGFGGTLDDFDIFGRGVTAVGDLDHDGRIELAVGVPNDDEGGMDRGAVWILFLDPAGQVVNEVKIASQLGGLGDVLADGDEFGTDVSGVGDVDDDGIPDLLVGAPGTDLSGDLDAGAAWLLFLRADGTVRDAVQSNAIFGLGPDDRAGTSVAGVGDLNGDRVPDIAVGVPGYDGSGGDRGRVQIVLLERDGTFREVRQFDGFDLPLVDGDQFGFSVAVVGDVTGDGRPELAVGAALDSQVEPAGGAVWILSLEPFAKNFGGNIESFSKVTEGVGGFAGDLDSLDLFGAALAGLGDIDGDGVPELAVAAPGDDDGGDQRGAIWILSFDPLTGVAGEVKLSAAQGPLAAVLADDDQFGVGLGATGDLDGDGILDLVAGASGDDGAGSDRGAIWLVHLDGLSTGACGDGLLDLRPLFGEECDDGNAAVGDGCFSSCEVEDRLIVVGEAAGGVAEATVEVDTVGVLTFAGETAPDVADLLAQAIEFRPALAARGIEATPVRDEVLSNGRFEGSWSSDPGLRVVDPGQVLAETRISDGGGGFVGDIDDGDQFGAAIASLGDLDGDGVGDIAVGAPMDDDAPFGESWQDAGAVWVLFLEPDGRVRDWSKISSAQLYGGIFIALNEDARFGSAVAGAGDVDGDGTPDLIVGAPRTNSPDSGVAALLLMRPDGTWRETIPLGLGAPSLSEAGSAIAALGDIDGNGVQDVAVGAPAGGLPTVGEVIIARLDGSTQDKTVITNGQSGFLPGSLQFNDRFGESVAALGDVDGDGVGDIAVGAPHDSIGGPSRGAVWVLLLNADRTVKSQVRIGHDGAIPPGFVTRDLDSFGSSVAGLGDLDGDGIPELAVGSPGAPGLINKDGAGAVSVFFLDASGTPRRSVRIDASQGGIQGLMAQLESFGSSVALLPDLDGDGLREVAAGAARWGNVLSRPGALFVLSPDAVSGGLCGNGRVDLAPPFSETCDDGNFMDGDGCWSTCEKESAFVVAGVAQGGLLLVEVGGVALVIATEAGWSALEVADAIAMAIALDPTLSGQGIGVTLDDTELRTNGALGLLISGDPGVAFASGPGDISLLRKISGTQGGFGGTLGSFTGFGIDVAALGDLDGDGIGDLAVGGKGDDDGGPERGSVWILFMNTDGTVRAETKISSTSGGLPPLPDNASFGDGLAGLGDVDGDGLPDLAVGTFEDGLAGSIYVLLLNADGTVRAATRIAEGAGGFPGDLDPFDGFGTGLAPLGDLNGDGTPDLAAGATGDDYPGGADQGAVWVLFLSTDGSVKSATKLDAGSFPAALASGDRFGADVAAVGDVDGDGISDLAISATRNLLGDGFIWIAFLEGDGHARAATRLGIGTLPGALPGDLPFFGLGLSRLGDIDGDGIGDLAAGSPLNAGASSVDGGSFWVIRLRGDGSAKTTARNRSIPVVTGDALGHGIGAFDPDGDGRVDLALGAGGDDDFAPTAGAVWLPELAGIPALCGDLDASALREAPDLLRLRQALADPAGAPLDRVGTSRCSVYPPAACDIVDAAVLARELAALAPGVRQDCPAAP